MISKNTYYALGILPAFAFMLLQCYLWVDRFSQRPDITTLQYAEKCLGLVYHAHAGTSLLAIDEAARFHKTLAT